MKIRVSAFRPATVYRSCPRLCPQRCSRGEGHTHTNPPTRYFEYILCSMFVKRRDAFVCVVQVCRRLQSAAGQLGSEGETGLWKTAQDHPPGRGSKVSLHTRSSLKKSVLYICFLKTFFCTDKFYMNSVQHQTKTKTKVYMLRNTIISNFNLQFTLWVLNLFSWTLIYSGIEEAH